MRGLTIGQSSVKKTNFLSLRGALANTDIFSTCQTERRKTNREEREVLAVTDAVAGGVGASVDVGPVPDPVGSASFCRIRIGIGSNVRICFHLSQI